jgi:hypothetical protein
MEREHIKQHEKNLKHRKMLRELSLKFVLGAETANAGKIPEKILPTSTSYSPAKYEIHLEKYPQNSPNEGERNMKIMW